MRVLVESGSSLSTVDLSGQVFISKPTYLQTAMCTSD